MIINFTIDDSKPTLTPTEIRRYGNHRRRPFNVRWQNRLLLKLGRGFAITEDEKCYYLVEGSIVLAQFPKHYINKLNTYANNPLIVVETDEIRDRLYMMLKPDNYSPWTPRRERWRLQTGLTRECGFSSRVMW